MSESDISLVRARRLEIARLRGALDAEDNELIITERTLARLYAGKSSVGAATEKAQNGARKSNGHITQRDMVIGTLKAVPQPWVKDSATLQARINEIHGVMIPMTSLQPYLSDMKKDGTVVRGSNGEIALTERVHTKTKMTLQEAAE